MAITEQGLRENYESQETEQLIELRDRGTLTDTALNILEQVLNERGVTVEERKRISAVVRKQLNEEQETTGSLASLGSRFFAQVIDMAIALLFFLIGLLLENVGINTAIMAGTILSSAYFLLADGLPGGQSIGKRLVGTAVVDVRTRKPCTTIQSFIRNIMLAFLGFIDWVFIFGRNRQRLGDMAANTVVIKV